MVVIAQHRSALERLGLTTLEGVRAFRGELVKNHRGRRDILRLRAAGDDGREVVLFLKRNWRPYRKDGLASLCRRGRVWSVSRTEWENSRALQAVGVATCGLVAWGEDCGLLWERFSFLITAAATGSQTLEVFLRDTTDRRKRGGVLEAWARTVRRLHDAGLATPDLFTRHVFVDTDAEPPRFCLIDMARLDRRRRLPDRLRARDLAALNLTAPMRWVTTRERVRFLKTYAGRVDKDLARQVAARVEHLAGRSKFADFAAPASAGTTA